jgi:hypothetical protein
MNPVRMLNFPDNRFDIVYNNVIKYSINKTFYLFDVVYDKLVGSGEHGNKFSGSVIYRKYLYQLNNYQFIK